MVVEVGLVWAFLPQTYNGEAKTHLDIMMLCGKAEESLGLVIVQLCTIKREARLLILASLA